VIDRRSFLGTLAGGLLATPLAVGAQSAAKVYRIGLLLPAGNWREPTWQPFEQALRDLGYVEGRNLSFEYSAGEVLLENVLSATARNLVRQGVDLVVTDGNSGARAAKGATSTVPIVVLSMFDAVESGLVGSLARPGGNITGISIPYPELATKRLELLKAAIPQLARVGFLTTGSRGGEAEALRAMISAARLLRLKLEHEEYHRPRDVDRAVVGMKTARVEALVVSEAAELLREYGRIARLATLHRLPSIGTRRFAEVGGLMAYGANLVDTYRSAAVYVDKILKGAKPADLPVEQPTKFELVVNLKTAKALGLTIPPSLLLRADQVIE
jgi:putative ABC transport system substrate-binding protein